MFAFAFVLHVSWATVASVVVVAAVFGVALNSTRKKDMAGLRQEEVEALQGLLAVRDKQIEDLRSRVAMLEGQVRTLTSDLGRTIASEVVRVMRDERGGP